MSLKPPDRQRIFCNTCKVKTLHECLFSHPHSSSHVDEDETDLQWWEAAYTTWKCCGCEAITFEASWRSEEDPEGSRDLYPPRNASLISPQSFVNIPFTLGGLYREVVDAFNAGNLILCASGLRALLEGVCVDKGITSGPTARGKVERNLEGKINGLKAIVSPSIVENLHGFRLFGNSALHDLERPRREDLALAIEIIEKILEFLYELDYKTARLYRQVKKKKSSMPPDVDGSVIDLP